MARSVYVCFNGTLPGSAWSTREGAESELRVMDGGNRGFHGLRSQTLSVPLDQGAPAAVGTLVAHWDPASALVFWLGCAQGTRFDARSMRLLVGHDVRLADYAKDGGAAACLVCAKWQQDWAPEGWCTAAERKRTRRQMRRLREARSGGWQGSGWRTQVGLEKVQTEQTEAKTVVNGPLE